MEAEGHRLISLEPDARPKKEPHMIQIQSLREECLTALANYAREAQKTCELLGEIEGTKPSLDQLLSVCAQAKAEDNALKSYLVLRHRFFDAWDGSECR
jgi:hypothetical protein